MEADFEKMSEGTSAVAQPQADTLFKSVLKTSLKTIICLFLLILLSVTYFFMRFPYHTMKLYMDFSMHKSALAYSERAVNSLDKEKQADKYAESLLCAIELSDMLLADTSNLKYAQKLIKFSEIYVNYSDFDEINSRLDDFYLTQIMQNSSDISLFNALSLYSYKDFVYSRNHYARALTNSANYILFNGEIVEVAQITLDDLDALSAADLAIFFNQIVFQPEAELFDIILNVADDYLSYCFNESSDIEQLYLLKAANNLYYALIDSFFDESERINEVFTIDGQAINDYLTEKLEQF